MNTLIEGIGQLANIECISIDNGRLKFKVSDLDLVKISQGVENNFVGLHCGIMDQFAIGMSKKDHAILLDCATVSYDYAPLDLKDNVILILNTNKRRDLVTSKYNERCEECATGLKIIQENYKNVKFLCELEESDLNIYLSNDEKNTALTPTFFSFRLVSSKRFSASSS